MKKSLILCLVIIGLLILAGCTSEPQPSEPAGPAEPEVSIEVVDIIQTAGYVSILYKVVNTGTVPIAACDIEYTATDEAKNQITGDVTISHLPVGESRTAMASFKAENEIVDLLNAYETTRYPGDKVPAVIYVVTGTAAKASVTYTNSTGGIEQISAVSLPWEKSFSTFSDDYVSISAQNQGESGTIETVIYVDGKEFKKSSSTGEYVIASASGTR